ncbi:hypothetical protein EMIT043CA1_50261 [Pseudomonas brassicacearum]
MSLQDKPHVLIHPFVPQNASFVPN